MSTQINTDTILQFSATVASETDAIFLSDLFDQFALAASWQQNKPESIWNVEILFAPEHLDAINQSVQFVNEGIKIFITAPQIQTLEDRDWLRENQESFPPLEIGNFYIYGSHIANPMPGNLHPLQIDAATAFGSGNHGSTKGCLLALSSLFEDSYTPNKILDLGCGSGVLAMAAAKLWNSAELIASDIDVECVRVTRENTVLNQLDHIQLLEADGLQSPKLISWSPYDLIIANILASVLIEISNDIVAILSNDGKLIVSGILDTQYTTVQDVYQAKGLTLEKINQIDEWVTLTFKK